MGPLLGVTVLDLSRILAGPWATQCLADFGATVWKIEKPGTGDDTRSWGPPWLKDDAGQNTAEAAYYLSANRAKRSVAINIADAQGQELVRRLAARADVLVENYKVGALAKYGLDFASLQKVNPRLVYCSISAFGQTGPDARGAGYDAMIQGMSGLMSITGEPDGAPQKVGVAVTDLMTGMYAVSSILAALYERARSGLGQHIDLALLDTQIATLANQGMNYLMTGRAPLRQGTAHPNIVPYQGFATADGHLMLAIGNDQQFVKFCEAAGSAGLARDERYRTNSQRVAHRATLLPEVQRLCKQKTTQQWLDLLASDVPCGPINDIGQAFAEPQVVHRAMQFGLPHPAGTIVPQVRNPAVFSRSELEYRHPAPLLGQHTDEVLERELALTAEELEALRGRAVIN